METDKLIFNPDMLINYKKAQEYITSIEDKRERRLLQNFLDGMTTMTLLSSKPKPERPFDALFFVKAVEWNLQPRDGLIEILTGGRLDAMNWEPDEDADEI